MIRDPNQSNPTLEPKQQTQVNRKKTKPRANQAITNKEKMPMTPKGKKQPRKFPAKSKTTVGQNSKGPLTIPMQNHFNPSQPHINEPMHFNVPTPRLSLPCNPMHSNFPSLGLVSTTLNPAKHSAVTLASQTKGQNITQLIPAKDPSTSECHKAHNCEPPDVGREDIDDDGDDSESEYMGDFDEVSESFETMVSLDEEDETEMEFAAVGFDQ